MVFILIRRNTDYFLRNHFIRGRTLKLCHGSVTVKYPGLSEFPAAVNRWYQHLVGLELGRIMVVRISIHRPVSKKEEAVLRADDGSRGCSNLNSMSKLEPSSDVTILLFHRIAPIPISDQIPGNVAPRGLFCS